MNVKKILVALLSIALLLGLVACGETAKPVETSGNTPVADFDPEAKGMLYLSMDAEVKVTYDAEGLVLSVEAANELGTELLTDCPVGVGTPCDVAVADLVKAYMETATAEQKVVLIKQAFGSESPSAKFLEDVRVDAEAVAEGRTVVVAAVESLTAEGYLNLDTVKEIFQAAMGAEVKFTVAESVVNGTYAISIEGEVTKNYSVNADTGRINFEEDEPIIETVPVETGMEYYEPEAETEPATDPFSDVPFTDPIFEDDITPPEENFTEEFTEPATEATPEG